MKRRVPWPAVWWWLCACLAVTAAESRRGGGKGRANQPQQKSACLDVPERAFDLILSRPAANSVTISVLSYQDTEGGIAYGTICA